MLTKKDIQENKDLIFYNINDFNSVFIGGSAGEQTIFPVSKKEAIVSHANHYLVDVGEK